MELGVLMTWVIGRKGGWCGLGVWGFGVGKEKEKEKGKRWGGGDGMGMGEGRGRRLRLGKEKEGSATPDPLFLVGEVGIELLFRTSHGILMVEMVGLGEGKVHGGYGYGRPCFITSSNVNRHWHKHVRES